MSPFLSWRPLVGNLRALTSAEMAAPRCIAAARMGFLLAALHSVAKRVSRGQAYHPRWSPSPLARRPPRTPPPPRSAAPFPFGSKRGTCPKAVGKIASFGPRGSSHYHRVSRLFPSAAVMGTAALASTRGSVRCRWARLPRVDPLCDRMERGEEEASTGRCVAFQRNHFCRRAGP